MPSSNSSAQQASAILTVGIDVYSQPYIDLHLKHRDADDRGSYSVGVSRVFDVRDAQGGRGGESLLVGGAGRISRGDLTGRFFAGEYQYERKGQFSFQPRNAEWGVVEFHFLL